MPKQHKQRLPKEFTGFLFLLGSILFACALFSYDPNDMSFGINSFFKDPPTSNNWIGIIGAYSGFMLYSLLGWVANLLPLVLLIMGTLCLFRSDYQVGSGSIWLAATLLTTACLIQVIGGESGTWSQSNQMPFGYGGGVGVLIGGPSWKYLKHGALIIFGLGSAACLWMTLQLKPREIYDLAIKIWENQKARKREKAIRTGDIKTVLKSREEEIAERQRLIERELSRRGKSLKNIDKSDRSEETSSAATKEDEMDSSDEKRGRGSKNKREEDEVVIRQEPEKPEYKITRSGASRSKPAPQKQASQPTLFGPYQLPPLDLLSASTSGPVMDSKEDISKLGAIIETTLKDFQIEVRMGEITQGSTVTRFEVIPAPGVKVERIVSYKNNLCLALKAESINILAPVAGKGTVGIEVANKTKAPVLIRDLIESREFQSSKARIPLALGKDVYGKTLIADLGAMPHLLIAGSTGSGKSVCINAILTSILYRFSPEDLRLILVDPKVVELQMYNCLPHLVVPVVSDPKKVIVALRWVVREMDKRYVIMAKANVRDIVTFNARAAKAASATSKKQESTVPAAAASPEGEKKTETEAPAPTTQPSLIPEDETPIPEKLPYIVVLIDELADLMQTASVEAEEAIMRIAQKARAAGIHLIMATQTPRADVVTGTIKTNLPAKIGFRVASKIDSRVILDENGAENLVGKGDMYYKAPDSSVLCRAQGAFVADKEIQDVVDFCSRQVPATYDNEIQEKLSKPAAETSEESEEDEELLERCIQVIKQEGRASTSLLQRRLRLGYTRAARIMDTLEARGVVGPSQGAKDREILIRLDGSPTGAT
jgi:DNA segregation ATPase FtsK/SpoIIIE, S-DNA-T family